MEDGKDHLTEELIFSLLLKRLGNLSLKWNVLLILCERKFMDVFLVKDGFKNFVE